MEVFRCLAHRRVGPPSDFVAELIRIYQDYWIKSLLSPSTTRRNEQVLFAQITRHLSMHGVHVRTDDKSQIEAAVQRHLSHLGLKSLLGVVKPLRELEIWSDERTKKYRVQIPDRRVSMNVTFISRFRCRGWLSFITQNVYSVGGWAKRTGLVCNASYYRIESETFRVGYLVHEAQHFADYRRFPKIIQEDLEYRAKLAELAFVRTTRTMTLQKFHRLAAPDRGSPHALANYFVIRDMAQVLGVRESPETWKSISTAEINVAAENLLAQNDEQLKSRGAKRTKGIIRGRRLPREG